MDKALELIDKEIATHRKLLNRAVGNRILPLINYHHYEIVRLIGEYDTMKNEIRINRASDPMVRGLTYNIVEEMDKRINDLLINGVNPK